MNVGTKEIPQFRLSSTLLKDLKTVYEKVGKNEVDAGVIAELLSHKSPKSGTFLAKIASMRDYGVLDGRGKLRVTDIGEAIAFNRDQTKFNDALIRAVNKIPLWHMLFEKYTQNGQDIPDADFWLTLKESCDLTIEEAKIVAPNVRNAYKEDIKLIIISKPIPNNVENNGESKQPSNNLTQQPQNPPQQPQQPATEGMIPMGYGDVKVYLPKEGTAEAWNKLKKMVDAYIEA